MKKKLLSLMLSPLILFSLLTVSYAGYTTTQLTENFFDDLRPRTNASGSIVWYGWDGSDDEIFLYDGESTIQLTDNTHHEALPQISDNGSVVWMRIVGPDKEIFLFDGTSTTQLTVNDFDDNYPQINASGLVVWVGNDGSDDEIFLYHGTGTTQLTDNDYDDADPRINASGQVVWCGQAGSDDTTEIFLYDGTGTTRLTDDGNDDENAQISDNGQVVWIRSTSYWLRDILLYNGSTITQLAGDVYSTFDDIQPQINANGHVVWEQDHDSSHQIFLYDGSTTTQLTSGPYNDWDPHINDNGYVVWMGVDLLSVDIAVFLYDGTSKRRLPQSQSPWIQSLRISNNGQVTWSSYVNLNYDVFLATHTEQWVPSSVAGAGDVTASGTFNHLVLLVVPAGIVLAWKVRNRR